MNGIQLLAGTLCFAASCVTALADTVKAAQQRAYEVAKDIHFDGAQYRKDIGFRAIR